MEKQNRRMCWIAEVDIPLPKEAEKKLEDLEFFKFEEGKDVQVRYLVEIPVEQFDFRSLRPKPQALYW